MKAALAIVRAVADVAAVEAVQPATGPGTGRVGYTEAAVFLGVKPGTLRSLVSRGQVPHIRLTARLCVFDLATLSAFLESKSVGAR